MSFISLLKLGRAAGLENFSQVKGLVRNVQSGKPFKCNLHLNISQAQSDEIVKAVVDSAKETTPSGVNELLARGQFIEMSAMVDKIKKMFPIATGKNNKTVTDLAINRYSPTGGFVSVKGTTVTPNGDVVASCDAKFLTNERFVKARAKASAPEQNYSYDVDLTSIKGAETDNNAIVKALKMDVKDGLFTAKLPKTKAGGTTLSIDAKANEEVMDSLMQAYPNPLCKDTKEMIFLHRNFAS